MRPASASTGSDAARSVARWSAQAESFLSTHAFEVLFFSIYVLANIFQFIWGAHDEFHHVRTGYEVENPTHTQFKWYIAIARGAGYTLNLNCALIILLACRLLLTTLRETPLHNVLPLDRAFPDAHVIVGFAILGGVLIHVPFHFAWLITFNAWDPLKLWSFSMSVIVGAPLALIFLSMFVTALPWFRRKHFRAFYIAHIAGAVFFFPLLILHGMYRKVPYTYLWLVGPLVLYAIDRILRRLRVSTAIVSVTGADARVRAGNVLELRVPKPFSYRAGQYAEVAVPALGQEWHPFTIASAPHERTMAFYVKTGGDWTDRLRSELEARQEDKALPPLAIRVRGPFGAPAQHSDAYRRVVLISGGIGATPFAAIAKHLHFRSTNDPHYKHHHKHGELTGRPAPASAEKLYQHSPAAERKISQTLSALYALGGAGVAPESSAVRDAAGTHVADTLSLVAAARLPDREVVRADAGASVETGAPAAPGRATVVEFSSSSDSSFYSSASDAGDKPSLPEELSRAGSLSVVRGQRARLLSFLHTTRVTLFLLMTVIARASLVVIVSIFDIGKFGWARSPITVDALWAVRTETLLSAFLTAVMALTIALELSFMRSRFFARAARCADLFVFVPLSLLATLLSGLSWARLEARGALTVLHFAVLLPLLFGLLAHRLYRSIGSRDLLADGEDGCKCSKAPPDVDFVWTTRTAEDDAWLLDELAHLEDGDALRLHRYITRVENPDEEEGASHIETRGGRPKWDALFADVAARAPSGSNVGVFFCGPPKMGTEIRRAMRKAEVQSNLRGAYLGRIPDWQLGRDLALATQAEVQAMRKTGSNVRFVFREENF